MHVLNVSAIVALGGVTQPDVHPENVSFPPIISGLLRPAKIGLASKGMTHGMTKLLCLSVRLGLYPTDICWLRLIQALEKPGIRVRHRWLFPVQFCLARDSEGEWKNCFQIFILFLQTLKYNCLYKSTRKRRVFTYCNSVCVFFFFFVICSLAVLLFFSAVLTQPIGDYVLIGLLLQQRHFLSSE